MLGYLKILPHFTSFLSLKLRTESAKVRKFVREAQNLLLHLLFGLIKAGNYLTAQAFLGRKLFGETQSSRYERLCAHNYDVKDRWWDWQAYH